MAFNQHFDQYSIFYQVFKYSNQRSFWKDGRKRVGLPYFSPEAYRNGQNVSHIEGKKSLMKQGES